MNRVTITINGQEVSVPEGASIVAAASEHGVSIPTLCYVNGYDHSTSCMICVVHDVKTDRLTPACSAKVSEGLVIETDDDRVRAARKDTLDLFLSEHVGDCVAPCARYCPARMDIPLMIRQIESGQFAEAIATVKRNIALPAVMGRICPAPCEKVCHRKAYDASVAICSLKRYVADRDLEQELPFHPEIPPATGKRVAILGSGPAGLSAAYYLAQYGHRCHIYDDHPQPGGMLRYGISEDVLPRSVLDAEIERVAELGVEFHMERTLGKDLVWDELRSSYDAVVVAIGTFSEDLFEGTGIDLTRHGIAVDLKTFETSVPGVFAAGSAVAKSRMAIQASGHGKFLSESVNQYLHGEAVRGPAQHFGAVLGKARDDDFPEFIKESEDAYRVEHAEGFEEGEAVLESSRCFGCDCRGAATCKLRQLADEYGADQRRFSHLERKPLSKVVQHDLVYEPGKCLKCGLCVQITRRSGEQLGRAFVGRGFDLGVQTPLGRPLGEGLTCVAAECIACCPTAALSWRDRAKE